MLRSAWDAAFDYLGVEPMVLWEKFIALVNAAWAEAISGKRSTRHRHNKHRRRRAKAAAYAKQ
jgi:hypothetical protein